MSLLPNHIHMYIYQCTYLNQLSYAALCQTGCETVFGHIKTADKNKYLKIIDKLDAIYSEV